MTEKLLGIESPPRKAHDDIKSIYGVDIPQNSGTIKQVVQIAQSQFGGDIAVAVRSPSVRQLVMLYSEATRLKMPLSATTPYAGSLVEQGGNLYQQASYQARSSSSSGSHVRLEHPDARRDRIGNLPDARRPEHLGRHRRDVPFDERQRQRRRELHDRPVRDAAVRDGSPTPSPTPAERPAACS